MLNLNQCTIAGVLGDDPQTRFTDNGHQLTSASIRIDEERNGQTFKTFVPIEAYCKTSDALSECQKGDTVVITGKLTYRSWQDDSGQKRGTTKVLAWQVQPVGAPVPVGARN